MAGDRQEPKETKEDADKEATPESNRALDVAETEDEQALHCGDSSEYDTSEVLNPDIFLTFLQQVVSKSKKKLCRVADPKPKCPKLKKTCKKKQVKRLADAEEAKHLSVENESNIPEASDLFNFESALEYIEKIYNTTTTGSRLPHFVEESLDFEDLYAEEGIGELELVAEIQVGDASAYANVPPRIFRRARPWRFQKSASLSTSGQEFTQGQSTVHRETAARPSRFKEFFGTPMSHININPCTPRKFNRTRMSADSSSEQNIHSTFQKPADRTSLHENASVAPKLPGIHWTPKGPLDAFSANRIQNDTCTERTSLINGNTLVKNTPKALESWGLALGNGTGVTGGQQRPLGGESSTVNSQHTQPHGSLEKDSGSSSSSSSCSQNPMLSAGGSEVQSNQSQDLDIYDPFHPTDEENVNGDYIYADSPEKETDDQEDQKYDPFEPTGSNASSSERSPSPYEDDDDDEIGSETHPEGRISEALAGIYDENSLSQDIPGSEKTKEGFKSVESDKSLLSDEHERSTEVESNKAEQRSSKERSDSVSKDISKLDFEPYSPSSSIDMDTPDEGEVDDMSPEVSEEKSIPEPPVADSTLEETSMAEASAEPIRRVFTVDSGMDYNRKTDFTSEAESKSKVEIKVSLESLAKPDMKSYLRLEKIAKLGSESRSRHKRKHSSERRDRDDDSDRKYDSEIEEGEIVQPDEDCFSPVPVFRSRCRVLDRPLRMVEGDDFLSLHADSDEEGALQIDFGENQMDSRWKGLDLRRKITNQRRERYRRKSETPPKSKNLSKSRSPSSSHSRKKSKRESKRSRERKRSKEPRTATATAAAAATTTTTTTTWSSSKKTKDNKDRKRSRSRSYKGSKVSRSRSRERRRSRSWSPSISTSLSAVGSSRPSAERRKSCRSKSKEKRRRSRSVSMERSRKDKHKDKHRVDGKKKKKRSRSKSRERDRDRRSSRHSNDRREKEKARPRHTLDEPKVDNPPLLERRRRDSRSVVPPSIQELNNADLFTIKRTITVNPEEKLDREELLRTPELSGKREVLYDSEGLSFDTYSDRETIDDRDGKSNRVFERHSMKSDSSKRRMPMDFTTKRVEEERDNRQRASKDRDRKRTYPDDRDRYKKRFKECSDPEPEPLKLDRDKIRSDKDKTPKKLKASHKDSKGSSTRKVKLQSKVAVLIREGVSSTTTVKEAGSIGVKFSRDRESRSPFLKSDEKITDIKSGRPKLEMVDVKEPLLRPKKIKGLKMKTGVKKMKPVGAAGILVKPKGTLEKKKKKLKTKASLKKSKADSCSQEILSPIEPKEESIWSDNEKTEIKVKPPSPPKPANEQELTPDSQTVDSSCKTPDVSFLPEELPIDSERITDLVIDSISEVKEEAPRPPPPPPPPPAPIPWNLQSGVDCTTSGVLALTALLFKMEEANMASRAKAQELIQATNQILGHSKPSTSLVTQPPPPPVIPSLGHSAPSYHSYSSLPLSGNSSPPTPPGISSLNSQSIPSHTSSSFFNTTTISDLGKREGSTSSEGRGDTDKYLKKLHTQERAVEEVKLAIKPYYQRKEITKEDYKDILRKAVHKICHSKSGEINPVKVNNLVKAYVQRYKYFRKHGKKMEDDESGSSYRSVKEPGALEKWILDQ